MDNYQKYTAEHYAESVESIAARLEGLARDLREYAVAKPNPVKPLSRPDYGRAATRAVHTLMWGMANLNLDGLVSLAQMATEAQLTADIEASARASKG